MHQGSHEILQELEEIHKLVLQILQFKNLLLLMTSKSTPQNVREEPLLRVDGLRTIKKDPLLLVGVEAVHPKEKAEYLIELKGFRIKKNPLATIFAVRLALNAVSLMLENGTLTIDKKAENYRKLLVDSIKLGIVIPDDVDEDEKEKRLKAVDKVDQTLDSALVLLLHDGKLGEEEIGVLGELMVDLAMAINKVTGGSTELRYSTKVGIRKTARIIAELINDPTSWKNVLLSFNQWLNEVLLNALEKQNRKI